VHGERSRIVRVRFGGIPLVMALLSAGVCAGCEKDTPLGIPSRVTSSRLCGVIDEKSVITVAGADPGIDLSAVKTEGEKGQRYIAYHAEVVPRDGKNADELLYLGCTVRIPEEFVLTVKVAFLEDEGHLRDRLLGLSCDDIRFWNILERGIGWDSFGIGCSKSHARQTGVVVIGHYGVEVSVQGSATGRDSATDTAALIQQVVTSLELSATRSSPGVAVPADQEEGDVAS
jgi:hypothetical protein